jgi:hypothetical protein
MGSLNRGSACHKVATYTQDNTNRINAHNIHAPYGIQTHDLSVGAGEDSSCLGPRGHCDRRHLYHINGNNKTLFLKHFLKLWETLVHHTLTHHVITIGLRYIALLIANLASNTRRECTSMKTIQLYSLSICELPKNSFDAQAP